MELNSLQFNLYNQQVAKSFLCCVSLLQEMPQRRWPAQQQQRQRRQRQQGPAAAKRLQVLRWCHYYSAPEERGWLGRRFSAATNTSERARGAADQIVDAAGGG